MDGKTLGFLRQAAQEEGFPLPQEEEESNDRYEALKRGFVAIVGVCDGPNVGITTDGSLCDTSVAPWREAEGLVICRVRARQIIANFGPGRVTCRAKVVPQGWAPIWQPTLTPTPPKGDWGYRLVAPDTPLGGGDTSTGWYRVEHRDFESLIQAARSLSCLYSDSVSAYTETLELAQLQVITRFARKL